MPRLTEEILSKLIQQTHDDFIKDIQKDHPSIIITSEHINNGFCADFTEVVMEALCQQNIAEDVDIVDDEMLNPYLDYSHTFLRFNGKYYDAECSEGVEDWTQLPCFLRDDDYLIEWV